MASGEPDITTSYVGEAAEGYIASVIYASNTLSDDLVTVLENVTKSKKLKILDTDNLLQDASCDFTHQGTITQTERSLDVEDFKVNLEFCKSEWLQGWEGPKMGKSRSGLGLPPDLFNHIIDNVNEGVGESLDLNIWIGNSTVVGAPTAFDGYIAIMEADAPGNRVAGDAAAATPANVLAKIRAVINAAPARLRNKADFFVYVAPNIAHAYNQHLGDEGWMNKFQEGAKPLNVDGYPMTTVWALPDNFIVVGRKSNLFFGTMMKADTNKVEILDMEPTMGDDNMRIIQKFKAGVQIAVPSQVYWTDNKVA